MKNLFWTLVFVATGIFFAQQKAVASWSPPIGIPTPPFGISETAPARPSPWTSTVANFYYVDNASGCNDSRTNGFPGQARCSLPTSVAAGSYIEVHSTNYNSGETIPYVGTAANPVWIVGQDYASRPKITASWDVSPSAAYVIMENLAFVPASSTDSDFGFGIPEGADHISLRHIEMSGNTANAVGGMWIGTWQYTGANKAEYIVMYDLNIHDLGQVVGATGDRDAHCLTINGHAENVWLVDSELTRCEGDGFQLEAGSGHNNLERFIYIGRNKIHGNKQSGMGVKHSSDVILSQNDVYDHQASSSAPGPCVGLLYDPERVWIINNRLHDCYLGIYEGSGDPNNGQNIYILNNIIYNIVCSPDPTNEYDCGAISMRGDLKNVYVVNNTIYDYDGGINIPDGVGIKWWIYNNIFANRHCSACQELEIYQLNSSVAQNNIFYRPGGMQFIWGGNTYTTIPFASQCNTNCSTANPSFVDAANANFQLNSGSPGIDTGMVATPYATFQTLYGMSIAYDFAGTARPANGTWDIGAYEYTSGTGNPTPIVGDINLDHIVNSIDYSLLNAKWFTSDATCDLNHDGLVNAIDYSILNANWFKTW